VNTALPWFDWKILLGKIPTSKYFAILGKDVILFDGYSES
jgi:hypothetical protein